MFIRSLIVRRVTITLFVIVFAFFAPNYIITNNGERCKVDLPLAINASPPSMIFSTYFGGNITDFGYDISVASDGSCYVTGSTGSSNFPTYNAYNDTYGGGVLDAFISKFNADGDLLWSTFFGGSNEDRGRGIAVNSSDGSCYITGYTSSSNFPTVNAYNETYGGNFDVFLAKFNSTGSLLWSTFLGGNENDQGLEIAIDYYYNNCFISGSTASSNFPAFGAYDITYSDRGDAFISKFNSDGTLLWSSYLGGNGIDAGEGIEVSNSNGDCYVTGRTSSTDFPTLNAYQSSFGNRVWAAFISKFSSTGSLQWSSYFGKYGTHQSDTGEAISLDESGNCYFTGQSSYTNMEICVAKFSSSGSFYWSTYIGGWKGDKGLSIAVNNSDSSCYVTGFTGSNDLPTHYAYDDSFNGGYFGDAFILKLSSIGEILISSYLGGNADDYGRGIAVTNDGYCYITGETKSNNFPILNAYNSTFSGSSDAFISKFFITNTPPYIPPPPTTTPPPPTSPPPTTTPPNTTSPTTQTGYAFGFLILIIVIPIALLYIKRKRRN